MENGHFVQISGNAIHELENIRKGEDFGGKVMNSAYVCAFKVPWRRPIWRCKNIKCSSLELSKRPGIEILLWKPLACPVG